ncbi:MULTISPECIES: hypothetical protein [Microbulbifer]|uniref:hypothetical protein n=1 Tax=Microbulbifer TaxID=48073 RepID=UPI001E353CAC|nr:MULTISPECIES: hypothetical protein [Microbulbifer]UHQ55963.1 hypothetical protein LVE68_02965 [Microbulbifer sp. YPW16]
MPSRLRNGAAAWALAFASAAPTAAVLHSESDEFVIRHEVELGVSSDVVFAGLAALPKWWSGDHSYSGDAGNFSFDLAAGGCFCERWGGASAEHLRVIYAVPEREVRLRGELGPLQTMPVSGLMRWRIVPRGSGATLTWEYRVWGAASAQLDRVAAPVDQVLGQQLSALAAYLGEEPGHRADGR